jgi:predicted transposase YbfD/YdcC
MRDSITRIFSKVADPRVENRCSHRLKDILFIAFCTLLSNGEDFEDMVEFGKQRESWLEEVLDLPNGIPSHDTFNRVLQVIDSDHLTAAMGEDAQCLMESIEDKLISFDGKKMRGVSPTSRGNKGLFILSAWVGENRICLGQKKIKDKSNEITAIPELIDSLAIEGSTVSIDAIGCQVDIAEKILAAKANYLLAVKGNQGNLLEQVSDDFIWQTTNTSDETWEYEHGRYETRVCQIVPAKEVLSPDLLTKWTGIKTLIKIVSTRTIKSVKTTESRFYISSQERDEAFYNLAVREHWGIENHLHWHLDVTFKEDANRSRSGNAPQNLNILRKMVLHRISNMDDRLSLKKRRYRASMNIDYLRKVVGIKV